MRPSQVRVAEKLGINQENVSRIEKRSDLLLSTLSGSVEAMGGKLSLVAEFPDRPPITLKRTLLRIVTDLSSLCKISRMECFHSCPNLLCP